MSGSGITSRQRPHDKNRLRSGDNGDGVIGTSGNDGAVCANQPEIGRKALKIGKAQSKTAEHHPRLTGSDGRPGCRTAEVGPRRGPPDRRRRQVARPRHLDDCRWICRRHLLNARARTGAITGVVRSMAGRPFAGASPR